MAREDHAGRRPAVSAVRRIAPEVARIGDAVDDDEERGGVGRQLVDRERTRSASANAIDALAAPPTARAPRAGRRRRRARARTPTAASHRLDLGGAARAAPRPTPRARCAGGARQQLAHRVESLDLLAAEIRLGALGSAPARGAGPRAAASISASGHRCQVVPAAVSSIVTPREASSSRMRSAVGEVSRRAGRRCAPATSASISSSSSAASAHRRRRSRARRADPRTAPTSAAARVGSSGIERGVGAAHGVEHRRDRGRRCRSPRPSRP